MAKRPKNNDDHYTMIYLSLLSNVRQKFQQEEFNVRTKHRACGDKANHRDLMQSFHNCCNHYLHSNKYNNKNLNNYEPIHSKLMPNPFRILNFAATDGERTLDTYVFPLSTIQLSFTYNALSLSRQPFPSLSPITWPPISKLSIRL